MAAVAMGFTSCEQDTDPVYHAPTTFVLNQPTMENLYINLQEGNTLELVASQPDYGYSAVAVYSAEMSLTEDFKSSFSLTPTNVNLARMTYRQEDIAVGLCSLLGISEEEVFNEKYPNGMPYEKIYFRAVCKLDGVEGSEIKSNVVAFNYVSGYFAVKLPGFIYLVGNPEGWAGPDEANAAHYADWRLFEADDAVDSHIYYGTFELPAAPMFRFYTALTGWDADSYGYIVDDNPTDFDLVDGSFTETLIKGKGSFNFPNFEGGKVNMVVDMSDETNMTFSMSIAD